ncbi:hypothetical protein KGF57_002815 [Candida theae]|uniref:Phosphatidic acid phosphatase type 2/haloperoxidase domain-containing protein n=1 Tax=Candida theae TaxID=1198502 RepID=A0AAD5FYF5_9ASCO|nr:uncharacterized protein KGF57_002815 [Candida theae]KAI5958007.1 hypothetical protein KGF57_002815 [Candida theae]
MSQLYLTSSRFRSYIPDWIVVICLIFVFFQVVEHWEPFHRQFYINDPRLLHPFATVQRVTDNELYVYSTLIPGVSIIITSLFIAPTNVDKLHLIQLSLLGLLFSVSSVSVLTDILKCWIGNPRPDFIQRCGPDPQTPVNTLVDISVCTSPLGAMYLSDGLKSTPSGHSSMAFGGLLYLSLWFIGQLRIFKREKHRMGLILVATLPVVFAAYIALSRTQDYRHHFFDVAFGSLLGIVFAWFTYWKYFGQLTSASQERTETN